MAQSPLIGPPQPADMEEDDRSPIMDRQWLTKTPFVGISGVEVIRCARHRVIL